MANDDRRKEPRDRRARAHGLVQRRAVLESGAEVARPSSGEIVTYDPETPHAVMETIEARRFELAQPAGNHAAPRLQTSLESRPELDVQAVGEEVTAAKRFRVGHQRVDVESHRRIVR